MSSALLPTAWDLKREQEIKLCHVPGDLGLGCYCSMTPLMLTGTPVRRPPPKSRQEMMAVWTRALEEERDKSGWSERDSGGEIHGAG